MKTSQRSRTSVRPCTSLQTGLFATELDLVEAIQKAFKTGSSTTWAWLTELDSPSGIADLVAIKRRSLNGTTSIATLPPRWAYILKCLPFQQSFSLPWFSEAFSTTPSYARGMLQLYVQAGFCTQNSRDKTWAKTQEPQPIAEKIVAVEAKLRDWRRALYQASRYLDYAGESWVVLEHVALAAALDHIEEFARRGVGLIGLSRKGSIEIASQSSERAPRMLSRFWHANAEIARRLQPSSL